MAAINTTGISYLRKALSKKIKAILQSNKIIVLTPIRHSGFLTPLSVIPVFGAERRKYRHLIRMRCRHFAPAGMTLLTSRLFDAVTKCRLMNRRAEAHE